MRKGETIKSMTDRVHVVRVQEADELWETVNQACVLVQRLNVKLVVIDSLTAIFRGDFRGSSIVDMKDRAEMLLQLAARMKKCSHEYECAFVLVNQVTAAMSNDSAASVVTYVPSRLHSYIEECSVKASLGMTWSNCVNDRVMIHRCRHHVLEIVVESTESEKENNNNTRRRRNKTKINEGRLRMFHIVLSSHASPSSVCFFRVQTEGIVGIPEDRVRLSYRNTAISSSSFSRVEAPRVEEEEEKGMNLVVEETRVRNRDDETAVVVVPEKKKRRTKKKKISIADSKPTEKVLIPC